MMISVINTRTVIVLVLRNVFHMIIIIKIENPSDCIYSCT